MKGKTILNITFAGLCLISAVIVYAGWQIDNIQKNDVESRVTTFSTSDDTWEKAIGGSHPDWAHAVVRADDPDHIVCAGLTRSFGNGFMSAYMVKLNASGDIIWDRAFGDDDKNALNDLVRTDKAKFVGAGFAQENGSKGTRTGDVYLLKVGSNGRMVWDRTYGGEKREGATALTETDDGGFLVTGLSESYGSGAEDIYVLRVNADGKKVWDRTFGGKKEDVGQCVVNAGDGEYIVGASRTINPEDRREGAYLNLIKVDEEGRKIWDKLFGVDLPDERGANPMYRPSDIVQTGDGHFIVAGWTNQAARTTGYLLKIDQQGTLVWARRMPPHSKKKLFAIRRHGEAFLVAGKKYFPGRIGYDGYLARINSEGKTNWFRTFGQKNKGFKGNLEEFYSVTRGTNGTLFVAGKNEMLPESNQKEDMYVLKLNKDGRLKDTSEGGKNDSK